MGLSDSHDTEDLAKGFMRVEHRLNAIEKELPEIKTGILILATTSSCEAEGGSGKVSKLMRPTWRRPRKRVPLQTCLRLDRTIYQTRSDAGCVKNQGSGRDESSSQKVG